MNRFSPRYTILFGLLIGFVVFVFSLIRALGQPIDFDATGYVWLS
jgi:hypoxanthine-guanine phosphoribosyltransferase